MFGPNPCDHDPCVSEARNDAYWTARFRLFEMAEANLRERGITEPTDDEVTDEVDRIESGDQEARLHADEEARLR